MVAKSSGVYSITNTLTDRVYVGSSVNIYVRHNHHFHTLKGNRHDNQPLQLDFNKFGRDAFRFDILELCPVNKLPEREKFYMNRFDVLNPVHGYNIMPEPYKGIIPEDVRKIISQKATGRSPSDETRRKIGSYHKGKIMSAESRAKMSKSQTGKVKSAECKEKCRQVNLGRIRSDEFKGKIRDAQRSKMKTIECYDLSGGLLSVFESVHLASRTMNVSRRGVNFVCQGKYKQCGGYVWKYVN